MKSISLPIFYHNDKTSKFEDLGIDYSLDKCEIRSVNFYVINAISPRKDDDYCAIHSNGSQFICKLSFSQVENFLQRL
jgi:hypothetical protein